MNANEILKIMKDFYGNDKLKFPKHIDINIEDVSIEDVNIKDVSIEDVNIKDVNIKDVNIKDVNIEDVNIEKKDEEIFCKIKLDTKFVKEKNMQEDCNAFEGWSIAIYTALKEQYQNVTIILDIKSSSDTKSDKSSGHWARFLYRAERFCRQYAWFSLSKELADKIEAAAETFKNYTGQYINNVPKNEAGTRADHNKENVIEAYLAEGTRLKEVIGNKLIFDGEDVYRQLPVGLFKDSVKDSNRVFPGGKSAIDLWSCKDDTFYVVELKTLNPMVGIITEIFFYANYMQDLLIKNTFTLNQEMPKKDRGYNNLLNHTFKNITGIMLADQYHPILESRTKEVLSVMNANGSANIRYYKTDYKYELVVLPK